MTQYTDNEIISKILAKCENEDILISDFIDSLLGVKEDWVQTKRIVEFIKAHKLADIVKDDLIVANPTTKSINLNGGYLKHLENEEKKLLHDKKVKEASDVAKTHILACSYWWFNWWYHGLYFITRTIKLIAPTRP